MGRSAYIGFLCLGLLSAAGTLAEAPAAQTPIIAELRIEGTINPVKARYVQRAIVQAREQKASMLLVSIDTPGGLVSSMQQIVSDLTNCGLPVIGLVEPATAQATSAGAFILLASDLAAMQPDTRVGAAHPVSAGEKLDDTMAMKATNSLVSLAKSLAARRGRSVSAAEAMVRDSASYTAPEAVEKQVVEWEVTGRAELFARLEGYQLQSGDRRVTLHTRGAKHVPLEMTATDSLIDRLADPTVASLLVSIGVLGILYELGAPGIGLGGIVGVISLLLGLSGLSVLPINLAGVLLFLAGGIALAIELHVPTHGLLGSGGVIAMTCGGLLLFDESRYFGALPHVDWHIQLPIVLLLGALLLLIASQAARALEQKPIVGKDAMLGAPGDVSSPFAADGTEFEGMVRVGGTYWRARSTTPLAAGDAVEVMEVSTQPLLLHVQRSRKGRS